MPETCDIGGPPCRCGHGMFEHRMSGVGPSYPCSKHHCECKQYANPSIGEALNEGAPLRYWRKFAMECCRYLNAEQIAAATKAAGGQAFICNPADRETEE